MTDDVILDNVNGVQPNEVNHNRMVEVCNVHPVTQVSSIDNTGNNVPFTSGEVVVE